MRRFFTAATVTAFALGVAACNGYNSSPTTPQTSPVPPADTVIVNVVGVNGALSFSPNPDTVPAGKKISWHNADSITHRVVFDDGELDTGNISPGAYSAPTGIVAASPYHCSIHPSMVGTITAGQ